MWSVACCCLCACKCCQPTAGRAKCWALVLLFLSIPILIAGFMTGQASADLSDNLKCITSDVNTLLGPQAGTIVGQVASQTAGAQAVSVIDQDTLDAIDDVADNLENGTMAPGVILFVLFLVVSVTAIIAAMKQMQCCFVTSKCFVWLSILFGLFAIVFFAIVMIAGVAAGQDEVKTEWANNVGTACGLSSVASVTNALNTATLAAQQFPSPQTTAAVNFAQLQLDTYTNLCSCVRDTLSKIEPYAAPGFLGMLFTFICLIVVIGVCHTMGCCKKFDNAKAVVPSA